jgi:hypothetical protein
MTDKPEMALVMARAMFGFDEDDTSARRGRPQGPCGRTRRRMLRGGRGLRAALDVTEQLGMVHRRGSQRQVGATAKAHPVRRIAATTKLVKRAARHRSVFREQRGEIR